MYLSSRMYGSKVCSVRLHGIECLYTPFHLPNCSHVR